MGLKTGAVVVVLAVLVVLVGFYANLMNSGGSQASGDGVTTTLPCSVPGVICGGVQLSSANLSFQNTGNDSWLLTMNLNLTGNTPVYSIDVFVNNTQFAYLQKSFYLGENFLTFSFPAGLFTEGGSYGVQAEGFYGNNTHIWANDWTQILTVRAT
ncbi:MAG TPA: hypothetical protein VEJ19_00335 [Nitrososphaerales archaeon]|nr:hypothetical protein [Nitrososphaerales archaeon]